MYNHLNEPFISAEEADPVPPHASTERSNQALAVERALRFFADGILHTGPSNESSDISVNVLSWQEEVCITLMVDSQYVAGRKRGWTARQAPSKGNKISGKLTLEMPTADTPGGYCSWLRNNHMFTLWCVDCWALEVLAGRFCYIHLQKLQWLSGSSKRIYNQLLLW